MPRTDKSVEAESRSVFSRVCGGEQWGVTANGDGVSFREEENLLEFDCYDDYTTL